MKRSKSIKLVVMASTAALLAGCTEEPKSDGTVFKNEQDCLSRNKLSDAECKQVIETGQKIHKESGPQYSTRALCQSQHGVLGCYGVTNPSSYFTATPYGFFLSAVPTSAALTKRVRPIYHDRQRRSFYTPGGYYVSHSRDNRWQAPTKTVKTKPKPAKIQTRTSVASRKGFGGRSRSSFSFGG